MEKTLADVITETEQKVVDVLNESNLSPEILDLIIRNIASNVRNVVLTNLSKSKFKIAEKEENENG